MPILEMIRFKLNLQRELAGLAGMAALFYLIDLLFRRLEGKSRQEDKIPGD